MSYNAKGQWIWNAYPENPEQAAKDEKEEEDRKAAIEKRKEAKMKEAYARMASAEKKRLEEERAEEAAKEARHQEGVTRFSENTPYNTANRKGLGDYYSRKERRLAQTTVGPGKKLSMADVERARKKIQSQESSQLECMRDLLCL